MFQQNQRVSISFTDAQKEGLIKVLDKFDAYDVAGEIEESIRVPGETVLTAAEVLILAGIIQPWYSFLSLRLMKHPGLF